MVETAPQSPSGEQLFQGDFGFTVVRKWKTKEPWTTFTKKVQNRRHRLLPPRFFSSFVNTEADSVWQTGLVPVARTAEKRHSSTFTYTVDSQGSAFMGFVSHAGLAQRCWQRSQLADVKQSQEKTKQLIGEACDRARLWIQPLLFKKLLSKCPSFPEVETSTQMQNSKTQSTYPKWTSSFILF